MGFQHFSTSFCVFTLGTLGYILPQPQRRGPNMPRAARGRSATTGPRSVFPGIPIPPGILHLSGDKVVSTNWGTPIAGWFISCKNSWKWMRTEGTPMTFENFICYGDDILHHHGDCPTSIFSMDSLKGRYSPETTGHGNPMVSLGSSIPWSAPIVRHDDFPKKYGDFPVRYGGWDYLRGNQWPSG
jgi:hypothetical protein